MDAKAATVTAADLRHESTVYLIPDIDDYEQAKELLRDCFAVIFEHALAGWMIDETIWPANRTYEMFRRWFDVEINSMVIDLCEYRFQVEEL